MEKEIKLQLPITIATYPFRNNSSDISNTWPESILKPDTHYPSTLPIFRPFDNWESLITDIILYIHIILFYAITGKTLLKDNHNFLYIFYEIFSLWFIILELQISIVNFRARALTILHTCLPFDFNQIYFIIRICCHIRANFSATLISNAYLSWKKKQKKIDKRIPSTFYLIVNAKGTSLWNCVNSTFFYTPIPMDRGRGRH